MKIESQPTEIKFTLTLTLDEAEVLASILNLSCLYDAVEAVFGPSSLPELKNLRDYLKRHGANIEKAANLHEAIAKTGSMVYSFAKNSK